MTEPRLLTPEEKERTHRCVRAGLKGCELLDCLGLPSPCVDGKPKEAVEEKPDDWDLSMPSRGLGDAIAKVTHATGIAQTVDFVAKAVGKDCGCGKRQVGLNTAFPFK